MHQPDHGSLEDSQASAAGAPREVALESETFLDALRRFDPDAQVELYEYYFGRITTWLMRKYPAVPKEDVLDCAQMALFKALTKATSFRGGSRFKTWLFRIALNEVLSGLARQRRTPTLEPLAEYLRLDEEDDVAALITARTRTPLQETLEERRWANIRAVFAKVEPEQLCIVEMERAGLTNQQMARELGEPVRAIEARKAGLRRSLTRITRELGFTKEDLL